MKSSRAMKNKKRKADMPKKGKKKKKKGMKDEMY